MAKPSKVCDALCHDMRNSTMSLRSSLRRLGNVALYEEIEAHVIRIEKALDQHEDMIDKLVTNMETALTNVQNALLYLKQIQLSNSTDAEG